MRIGGITNVSPTTACIQTTDTGAVTFPQDSENAGRTRRMLALLHGATDHMEKSIMVLRDRVGPSVVPATAIEPCPNSEVDAEEPCSPIALEIRDAARGIERLSHVLRVLTQDIDL